jgi:hypothetical protein
MSLMTVLPGGLLPPSSAEAMARVQAVEDRVLEVPQVAISTHHVLHAGMYHRTIMIPAGTVLTGARIKIPTTLAVAGHVSVVVGEGEMEIEGYAVIPAAAGRKQAFIAHTDTWVTMSFHTSACTVEQAEEEFTGDHARLMSRTGHNEIVIGEMP